MNENVDNKLRSVCYPHQMTGNTSIKRAITPEESGRRITEGRYCHGTILCTHVQGYLYRI